MSTVVRLNPLAERCYSCGELRWPGEMETCPECGVNVCDHPGCASKCKCDELPDADSLLSCVEFRKLYCFCDAEKCDGCFFDKRAALTFTKDRQGRYLYVCNNFHTLLGLKPSDLLGKTSAQVFPDPMIVEAMERGDEAAIAGQIDTRVVIKMDANGNKHPHLVRKMLLPNGLIMGMAVDLADFLKAYPASHGYAHLHRTVVKATKKGWALLSSVALTALVILLMVACTSDDVPEIFNGKPIAAQLRRQDDDDHSDDGHDDAHVEDPAAYSAAA